MPLKRTFYDALPNKDKIVKKLPSLKRPLKVMEKKESKDTDTIRDIINKSDLNFPQDCQIQVMEMEPIKKKEDGLIKLMPQFRVNIIGRNFAGHYNMGKYVYKSFWVTKEDGMFNFSPRIKS